jgi:Zn-finger nucleic acid-binding protein
MKKTMRCTCAAGAELLPAELAEGLAARSCAACGGFLLEMDDYLEWRNAMPARPAEAPPTEVAADSGARTCPSCARLMHRYRVPAGNGFRIDRCASCALVWFDAGEWQSLAAAGLAGGLEEILSDGGQRQLQANELRRGREAALRARHGDACVDELARVREWLETQPARDELVALLRAGW